MQGIPRLWVLALTLVVLAVPALGGDSAAATDTASNDGWYHPNRIVDFDFVAQYVKPPGRADAVIIDSRPRARKYEQAHIPTAVSIPDSEFAALAATRLPADRSTLLIFYCGGPHCPLSHRSAFRAEALGYHNVRVYAAGFPDWKRAGGAVESEPEPAPTADGVLDLAGLERLRATTPERLLLVDVRAAEEFTRGTLADAINVPSDGIVDALDGLPADRVIVFFCSSGARAGETYDIVRLMRPELEVYVLEAELEVAPDGSCRLKAGPG